MRVGERGKCPHCLTIVQFLRTTLTAGGHPGRVDKHPLVGYVIESFRISTAKDTVALFLMECPNCYRPVVSIVDKAGPRLVYPVRSGRPPPPSQVPKEIAQDYDEACLVLPFSPKASAALSRRCLQAILRDAGKTKKKDLADQIEEILPTLPSALQKSLDAVRNIGNFATHPMKSKSTGEIVEVETGEAEWNLEVIEALFDLYYVQPSVLNQKRKALDEKLKQAGKPPLK